MSKNLITKKCVPCEKGVQPFKGEHIIPFFSELKEGWNVIQDHHLEKTYLFKNFQQALAFTNEIGMMAEKEGHHPDIYLSWGKVKLQIWTHKINGLSENDFILAAKCDAIFEAMLKT